MDLATKLLCFLLMWILSNVLSVKEIFRIDQIPVNNEVQKDFEVYWNVPTFMCHKYGMSFEEVSSKYGIRQNDKDEFRGDKIFILYDPGNFPSLLKNKTGGIYRRNGGVPQEGNLTHHLEIFSKHVKEQVKNTTFSGIAVIDFESWRPIFRQNWASLDRYREISIKIEGEKLSSQQMNSSNSEKGIGKKIIRETAVINFESQAKIFMEETLTLAKKLRPFATWGYYAYPYCYNVRPKNPSASCDQQTQTENDRLDWLFSKQQALFPSVYWQKSLNEQQRIDLINGRVKEALRVAEKFSPAPKVLPYFSYKFQDHSNTFLSKEDSQDAIGEIVSSGSDGLIIWGSSNDLNSKTKCQKLKDHLKEILGPVVSTITKKHLRESEENQI